MSNTRRIEIYDTTLRDGTQGEGFNLSLQDKLLIAQKLDDLGVAGLAEGVSAERGKHRFDLRPAAALGVTSLAVGRYLRSIASRTMVLTCCQPRATEPRPATWS